MNSGFGDDVCVETVAEIDGIDVVTVFNHRVSASAQKSPFKYPPAKLPLSPISGDSRRRTELEEKMRDNIPLQITIHNGKEDL